MAKLLDGTRVYGSFTANTAVIAGTLNVAPAIASSYDKANSANVLAFNTGVGANAFASATIAGANTAVGGGANNYLRAIIAGANTAVGGGANAFTSATVAGANTAVGTGANNYLLAVIAGANTAVGTGANAFTSATIAGANTAVGTGANNYLLAVIAGANTAVGTGANNYLLAVIAGANTAVGGGANAFTSATVAGANSYLISIIAGANTAVGAGANTWANTKLANTSGVSFNGNLFFPTGNVGIGTSTSTYKLTVSGNVGITGTNVLRMASDLNNPPYIKGHWTDNNNSGLEFHVFNNTVDTTSLYLSIGGNVGIGRTSAGYKLDVDGTVNASAYLVNGTPLSASVPSYKLTFGDGSANSYNINHALNTTDVVVAVKEVSTGYYVYPDVKTTTANHVVIEFVVAPTTNQYRVIVIGT